MKITTCKFFFINDFFIFIILLLNDWNFMNKMQSDYFRCCKSLYWMSGAAKCQHGIWHNWSCWNWKGPSGFVIVSGFNYSRTIGKTGTNFTISLSLRVQIGSATNHNQLRQFWPMTIPVNLKVCVSLLTWKFKKPNIVFQNLLRWCLMNMTLTYNCFNFAAKTVAILLIETFFKYYLGTYRKRSIVKFWIFYLFFRENLQRYQILAFSRYISEILCTIFGCFP